MLTILGSIDNIIEEDLRDHLLGTRNFTLMMNKMNIQTNSKNHEESGYGLEFDMLTILYQSHVFISYEKWGSRWKKDNHLRPII